MKSCQTLNAHTQGKPCWLYPTNTILTASECHQGSISKALSVQICSKPVMLCAWWNDCNALSVSNPQNIAEYLEGVPYFNGKQCHIWVLRIWSNVCTECKRILTRWIITSQLKNLHLQLAPRMSREASSVTETHVQSHAFRSFQRTVPAGPGTFLN